MNPDDIYKALDEIRSHFPGSSKMTLLLIEPAGTKGAFDEVTERAALSSMKSAWQLENRAPTRTFVPTDESVIAYVRSVSDDAAKSPVKMLIAIELNRGVTSVWVLPKGMCFIATVAYGSPLATEVLSLSDFRDEVLLPTKLGMAAVRLYYNFSPTMAAYINESSSMKAIVRACLYPVVRMVKILRQKERASLVIKLPSSSEGKQTASKGLENENSGGEGGF